jgi:ferritin-like protein
MRYYATIELEIIADDEETAQEIADVAAEEAGNVIGVVGSRFDGSVEEAFG